METEGKADQMKQLRCGAAKECITPPASILTRLRGLKQYRFSGVIDEIYVRAMALESGGDRALLVAFDMTTAPCTEGFLKELSSLSGTKVENIMLFSIHTHAVPFNYIDLEEREAQTPDTLEACREYTRFLHERTRAAVERAVGELRPARMGYAFGESRVNVVRLQDYTYTEERGAGFTVCGLGADYAKPADRTLFTLRIEDMDGRPIAFLINYPMHNVCTIWNDFDGSGAMGVSGDVGGRISRLLEKDNPGSVALWSSGAAGDLNPVQLNEIILPDPETGRPYEYHPRGTETALAALLTVSERHYADIKRTLRTVRYDEGGAGISAAVEWSRTPGCDCVRRAGKPPEFVTGPQVPEHTVRLQMLRIGGLKLIGAGAEIYSSIGRAMLDAAGENSVLITHNASALCRSHYILDDETIARCDASRGFAMVPGYDEYRCQAGIMKDDLISHVKNLSEAVKGDGV